MGIPFAFVHHANQYLITEGYENRHGLRAALGSIADRSGFTWILELHRRYNIPFHLHLSGTLIEAIAWHQPEFLLQVRELLDQRLVELVGSCYAQNIMRFFTYEHNLRQLNEELRLYQIHLGVDPESVKTFWPPERVWDTPRMAPVLRDGRLLNQGYDFVLLDDRLQLPVYGPQSPRKIYDRHPRRDAQLYEACRIQDGHGLVAIPIATHLRLHIPAGSDEQFQELLDHCRWLASTSCPPAALIALYGDDLEKAAGIGAWGADGPAHFERVLRWVSEDPAVTPTLIRDWGACNFPTPSRPIDVGTFLELANHFAAGEGYEKWFFDPQWEPYRKYYSWAESRVEQAALSGGDAALVDLANKHLMASSWESAWHTPSEGPFGDPDASGAPSPWIRALGSHCRHAAVIAEASYWSTHRGPEAQAVLQDIDNDGEDEVVLKNDRLLCVISPRWGGRVVALFSVEGPHGVMVIGNPSDDWNWMEELNRFMEVPPNHPGALTDRGMEHDAYRVQIARAGSDIEVELTNIEPNSKGLGLIKKIRLASGQPHLGVEYRLPGPLTEISVDFSLSPDYLSLLRYGHALMKPYEEKGAMGWMAGSTAVWVRGENAAPLHWCQPYENEGGHKATLRASTSCREFAISIGVTR